MQFTLHNGLTNSHKVNSKIAQKPVLTNGSIGLPAKSGLRKEINLNQSLVPNPQNNAGEIIIPLTHCLVLQLKKKISSL